MTGRRRAPRSLQWVVLGLLTINITTPQAHAQDAATSLSASFRKAAARTRGSLVSLRAPENSYRYGPWSARFGPASMTDTSEGDPRTTFSGVVIDADQGHILTIEPQPAGISQLLVTFPDGHERLTSSIVRDPRSGLAIVSVDPKDLHLTAVRWGNPATLEPGDWLVALGQPGVGDPSMSVGVFGTRRRGGGEELIETDAAIARVGGGAILIDLSGEVVGIAKRGGRRADGFGGMGHAIPADRARRVGDDLIRFGQVRRAFLGVAVQPIEPTADGRVGRGAGVRVTSVAAGTPAAEAGLRPGDVIRAVGQRPVDAPLDLQEAVERVTLGDEVVLDVERQGQRMGVKARPRPMPGPAGATRTPRTGPIFTPEGGPPPAGPLPPLSFFHTSGSLPVAPEH